MLSIGIVGLPNVGKSTLFNALTKKSAPAENFPFCTIKEEVGIVEVPDKRLLVLTELNNSKKTIHTAIEFVDIAGLIEGAHKGEGRGNDFLHAINECDAIAQVVRIFEDSVITHVKGSIDPLDDIETIGLELVLADLSVVTKRIKGLEREVKRGDKKAMSTVSVLEKARVTLEDGKLLNTENYNEEERSILVHENLLTIKPMLYVLNKKSGGVNLDELKDERWQKLEKYLTDNNLHFVLVDASIEQELSEIEDTEREEYRVELGVADDGISELIKTGFKLLNLITFLTTGEDETRAWTTKNGSTAPQAGASIHSDFEEKFIRAEIIAYTDLIEVGTIANARTKGLLRIEGKEYIVKDGDIIEFKV